LGSKSLVATTPDLGAATGRVGGALEYGWLSTSFDSYAAADVLEARGIEPAPHARSTIVRAGNVAKAADEL
jgi:hypothetical protein